MRAALALLLLTAGAAGAEKRVTIEKATIPWADLERLLRSEGQRPPAARATPAPRHYALTQADVSGEVEGGRAALQVRLRVEVLDDRWVLVPLLPAGLAIASAAVEAPPGHRGLLVREPGGVLFAAEGAGSYALVVSARGELERGREGRRLRLELPGLTGGRASLAIRGGPPGGRTAWEVSEGGGGQLLAQAALGAEGLDLLLPPEAEPAPEAAASVDGLVAVTVVSLGGSGVTRLTFHATPAPGGGLELELPKGARVWKVYLNGRAQDAPALAEGGRLRLPLKGAAEVEVAYTFELPPLGIRGRYRVELPRVPVPVRDAAWQLWLPEGLSYGETQAALQLGPACEEGVPPGRTPLRGQGRCLGFRRAVLEPGAAYAEGSYAQAL